MAKAIGYPQEVPAEADAFVFMVDGREIEAKAEGGGLVLRRTLLSADDAVRGEDTVVRLAGFAAGRLLKEGETLAWDPETRSVILWIAVKADGDGDLRRAFESFCTSVDWWTDRVADGGSGRAGAVEMMIRP